MKQTELTIIENLPLCTDVYRVVLAGDTSAVTAPGQFVNLKLDGFFLRRPISVCDWDTGQLSIIYKVVGRGTAAMARLRPGAVLDTLTGLGNGYDLSLSGNHPLLVGGGVGEYRLCTALQSGLSHKANGLRRCLGLNMRTTYCLPMISARLALS